MSKKLYFVMALVLLASMVLSACAQPEAAATTAAPAAPTEAAQPKVKVCQVTDVGGIDDKTFNATAWKGVQDSVRDLGAEGKYLESQQQTDYEKNINAFIEEGCDLIVTVGFLLGTDTQKMAEANPDQKFAIIDSVYDPVIPNVVGTAFSVDQPSFLAGYLAAGMSKTGKVGTYGGIQIPPLEPFMTGFVKGVAYYNEKKGTNVEALGWDPAAKTGLFTGNFESLDDGRRMAETLMDEGADIIFPVAGPCGLGSAAAIQERGGSNYMIGVDTDMTVSSPEYTPILLTSVLKNMDKAVYKVVQDVVGGTFKGSTYIGDFSNDGVGLAPYHNLDSAVPAELKAEIEQLRKDIAAGTVKTME